MYKPSLYTLVANGDSMAPEIEDSDMIVCDPDLSVESGDMVHYSIHGESAVKIYVEDKEAHIIQFIPYNPIETFKTRTVRIDDVEHEELKISKVVHIVKSTFNNRKSRLKLIGRG